MCVIMHSEVPCSSLYRWSSMLHLLPRENPSPDTCLQLAASPARWLSLIGVVLCSQEELNSTSQWFCAPARFVGLAHCGSLCCAMATRRRVDLVTLPVAKRPRHPGGVRRIADALASQLHECFNIKKIPRIDNKSNLKSSYVCLFCNTFDKELEGPQRVVEHAMGCSTKGRPVKGCPVRAEGGSTGIPRDARNRMRDLYELPHWSADEMVSQKAKDTFPPATNQAHWGEWAFVKQGVHSHRWTYQQ